jgi:predicted alpha/beta-hydrolase family hydrolase
MQIEVIGKGTVSAVRTEPEGTPNGWVFAYAPGAGARLNDGFGVYASRRLSEAGIATVRFQFPYMEAGKRRPDRNDVLEATWTAVLAQIRGDGVRVVAGGRSMGGRIASQVAAKEAGIDALALFAYPLHPPWNRSQRRDLHFPDIKCPTLFCSGTRDEFATPDELSTTTAAVEGAYIKLLDGADHGFNTLKRSGRTREQVWEEAVAEMIRWLPA